MTNLIQQTFLAVYTLSETGLPPTIFAERSPRPTQASIGSHRLLRLQY